MIASITFIIRSKSFEVPQQKLNSRVRHIGIADCKIKTYDVRVVSSITFLSSFWRLEYFVQNLKVVLAHTPHTLHNYNSFIVCWLS
jgi:hypothetical protein